MTPPKSTPRPGGHRIALAGILSGAAVAVTVLVLGQHFADTRNRTAAAAVLGGLVLLMLAADLTGRRGQRIRTALGTLAGITVTLAVVGGLYWIIGRHWGEPATYTAGVAWCALLAAACRGVYLVRRRLYWRKHRYSPQDRAAQARAEALWRRR